MEWGGTSTLTAGDILKEPADTVQKSALSEAKEFLSQELADEPVAAERVEKVSRYEAHLSRLMFKALHELEAIQVRRSGGGALLARLDVDGLAGD